MIKIQNIVIFNVFDSFSNRRKRQIIETYLCDNCLQNHIINESCTNNKIIACRNCYRINVRTSNCNCNDRSLSDPPQVLRLVGDEKAPRMFVDIQIIDRTFSALINTGLQTSVVNETLYNWLCKKINSDVSNNSQYVTVPITINNECTHLECLYSKNQELEIELGMHFLKYYGFSFIFNGTIINSDNHITEDKDEIEYFYNIEGKGDDLRQYLKGKNHFMKKKRIMKFQEKTPIIAAVKRRQYNRH